MLNSESCDRFLIILTKIGLFALHFVVEFVDFFHSNNAIMIHSTTPILLSKIIA
jgi:hypothetical protein